MRTSALLAAIALAVAIAGCGGDDDGGATTTPASSPTATRELPEGTTRAASEGEKTYFTAIAAVLDEAHADSLALAEEKSAAFDLLKTETQRQEAAVALATDTLAKMELRRDSILNVKPQPPQSMHSLHLDLGGAADDTSTVAANVADTLTNEAVNTEAEYDALLQDLGADETGDRYREACIALENESVLLELDVDLHCDG